MSVRPAHERGDERDQQSGGNEAWLHCLAPLIPQMRPQRDRTLTATAGAGAAMLALSRALGLALLGTPAAAVTAVAGHAIRRVTQRACHHHSFPGFGPRTGEDIDSQRCETVVRQAVIHG